MKRISIRIEGAVQGVGFRPFVYRIADEMGLKGFVRNSPAGLEIDVEGGDGEMGKFLSSLRTKRPPLAMVQSIHYENKEPIGYRKFEIRDSAEDEPKSALVMPDVAICDNCLKETLSEKERRCYYPFTNCTNCGPRFSIIEKLPYDRPNTTMRSFKMCKECQKEYDNPKDRRFHAQPIACPKCGPYIFLMEPNGEMTSKRDDALMSAAKAVKKGSIVAVKGLGGFLLICDARNGEAVRRLRSRKHREEKPLAVMYPDIESVRNDCQVSQIEEDALLSPQHPIVLLRKKENMAIDESVAPSNPYLGVMLPYAPLHHLLVNEIGSPVVATSGNRTDDPIAIDNDEAISRLNMVADYFLMHNREIKRRVDDSVVRVFENRLMMLRRARGYAPLPITWRNPKKIRVLALGAHLKSTVSFSKGDDLFVSQHIGDLETKEAIESFREVVESLKGLYEFEPDVIATDLHPNYVSTKMGEEMCEKAKIEPIRVQHHHAHIASCMCENGIDGSVLGVAWDGVGYGINGRAWGSEFLIADYEAFERFAHFLSFPLPGGEQGVRKISNSGLGALYMTYGSNILDKRLTQLPALSPFTEKKLEILLDCMKSNLNSPPVYGIGRLFDAVASIIGIRQECSFEAQAAMQLEFAGRDASTKLGRTMLQCYPYELRGKGPVIVDWRPMVQGIVEEHRKGIGTGIISLKMHQTLAKILVNIADMAGERRIVLSGGVFQNTLLCSLVHRYATGNKFKLFSHSLLPPNDGCISAGQCAVAITRAR